MTHNRTTPMPTNDDGHTENEDETRPLTMAEIDEIVTPERMAELDALATECERRAEATNLIPYDPRAEDYIGNRYPIALLYARSELQDIAVREFGESLMEEEILLVRDAFADNYPFELDIAITEAVESVLKRRIKSRAAPTSRMNNAGNDQD